MPRQHPARLSAGRTCALLRLLQAGKRHLGPRDVLFRVLQVLEERPVPPGDALVLVGRRVLVALDAARLAAKQPEQVRPELVGASLVRSVTHRWSLPTHLLEGVALAAARLEELGSPLNISYWH